MHYMLTIKGVFNIIYELYSAAVLKHLPLNNEIIFFLKYIKLQVVFKMGLIKEGTCLQLK